MLKIHKHVQSWPPNASPCVVSGAPTCTRATDYPRTQYCWRVWHYLRPYSCWFQPTLQQTCVIARICACGTIQHHLRSFPCDLPQTRPYSTHSRVVSATNSSRWHPSWALPGKTGHCHVSTPIRWIISCNASKHFACTRLPPVHFV